MRGFKTGGVIVVLFWVLLLWGLLFTLGTHKYILGSVAEHRGVENQLDRMAVEFVREDSHFLRAGLCSESLSL